MLPGLPWWIVYLQKQLVTETCNLVQLIPDHNLSSKNYMLLMSSLRSDIATRMTLATHLSPCPKTLLVSTHFKKFNLKFKDFKIHNLNINLNKTTNLDTRILVLVHNFPCICPTPLILSLRGLSRIWKDMTLPIAI